MPKREPELEALADEYRAAGKQRYPDALLGAWDIYHDGYLHPGGITAICESDGPYPFKSDYITTGHNRLQKIKDRGNCKIPAAK